MAATNCNVNNNNNKSTRIADFYESANVLITGATGFVGKALLEKLLRCCKGIVKIYLLMRSKKGVHVQERLRKLLESAVKCFKSFYFFLNSILLRIYN